VAAAGAAAVAGVILAAAAIVAARTFARPATRCMILGGAFGLAALTGPFAFAGALLRPAATGTLPGGAGLEPFAAPLLGAMAALALALLIDLALDAARLRAIKNAARPIGSVAVRRARIALSDVVGSPTAIGYLHPAIVLPSSFRRRVDEAEWQAVIAHEAAHLARGDDWAKAVQSAVLRLGWWLPGLWILARALDLEREAASDERAVRAAGARRYAACLLRLATSDAPADLAPAFGGRRAQIAIRVERLLRPGPAPSPIVRAAALGIATAVTLAVLATAIAAVPAVGRGGTPPVSLRRLAALPARRAAPAHAAPALRTAGRRPVRALVAAAAIPAPAAPRRVVAVAPHVHHARAARPAAVPVVGMLALRLRCATCFGPLRSPDAASALPAPPPVLAPASVAIATGSGPGGLRFGLMSLSLPRALAVP
jgi:Zn-dependent protease with chaperone function